jgi:glucose/arabinose dehydrogenase
MVKINIKMLCCSAIVFAICSMLSWPDAGPISLTLARDAHAQETIQLLPVLTGLSSPIYLTNAHDGSNRLFIVEQAGIIKVLQPGSSTPTIFLDITTRVLPGGERGLLGLAFHPQFPDDPRFFVYYTRADGRPNGAEAVVAAYEVSATDPNVAEMSETPLLVVPQPFANHNGGMIEFGPDGFLYIAKGDGGSGNDPGNRAQNKDDLLGKILRIDVDSPSPPQSYSSPSDNPFFGSIPGRDEIYAWGFRNPWRFSFDRLTGQLYVADVGQGAREEIDLVTLGGNYGWRVFEGTVCTNLDPALCTTPQLFIPPIAEYAHQGGRCSVTGGYVYRGTRASLPVGTYVFGDYCTGEIFLLENSVIHILLDTQLNISSFGEDEAGELYVVGHGGTIYRIINPNPPPGESTSAEFVEIDPATQGNWQGVYGAAGYQVVNDAAHYPGYVRVTPIGPLSFTWEASTADPRGLQKASTSGRLAATWYATTAFTIDVDLTDGLSHQVALYCVDWDSTARVQVIEVLDAATGALLDSRTLSAFSTGQYLVWNIRGHVQFRVTRLGGHNAVVSGIFFDAD